MYPGEPFVGDECIAAISVAIFVWNRFELRVSHGQVVSGHGPYAHENRGRTSSPQSQMLPMMISSHLNHARRAGYGFSSKPDPGPWDQKNALYNFETWSKQVSEVNASCSEGCVENIIVQRIVGSLWGEDPPHGPRVRITVCARRTIDVKCAVKRAVMREEHEAREGPGMLRLTCSIA